MNGIKLLATNGIHIIFTPQNIYELNFSQLFKTWEASTTEKLDGKTNTFCIIIKYYI